MDNVFNARKSKCQQNNTNNKSINCKPLALAIAVAISGSLPNIAHAATYTVTSNANSGVGSLRQAILDANATLDTPDTIIFDTSMIPVGSTITLTSGEIAISDTLTITGPIADDTNSIVIDGNNSSQLLVANFSSASGKTITLNNMTLQNGLFNQATSGYGFGGGAVFIKHANLVMNHSTVKDSTVSGAFHQGGGIYVTNGNVTLNQSTVSGNSATGSLSNGGGIKVAFGNVTLNNSTISGNTTNQFGGGVQIFSGDIELDRSTISGNQSTAASGGGIFSGGETTIYGSTITNNSSVTGAAGLSVPNSSVNIKNSILSQNLVGAEGNFFDRSTINNNVGITHSFFGDVSAEVTGTNNGNIFNDNPQLGPLLNNGGNTQTHLPNISSPVIDKGFYDYIIPAFDQRGIIFYRSIGSNSDIGAVELQTTTPSVVTNTNDSGAGSLRQAVIYANNSASTESIIFENTIANQTITLNSEITVTDGLTISGPTAGDATSLILDGNNSTRIINATAFPNNSGETVTLENITLQNGNYAGTATGSFGQGGAAIAVRNADLTLNNTQISNNKTTGDNKNGGGVFLRNGNAVITQSVISGNSTEGNNSEGGGFSVFGDITLNQSTVSGNSTEGSSAHGGGFSVFGDVTLSQSTVSGNSTEGDSAHGGGIYVVGNTSLIQSTLTNNSSESNGAGLFVYGYANYSPITLTTTLINSILSGNNNTWPDNLDLDSYVSDDGSSGGSVTHIVNSTNSLFGDPESEITDTNTNNVFNNNPGLGPLQNNGGPTLTKAPISGSPVIGAGSNTIANNQGFMEDQRGLGFPRIVDTTVDIGAVEAPTLPNKNNVVKRAEIVKPILLAAGLESLATNGNVYDDVAANAFNATWINRFKSEGLTEGCDDNPDRFCPNSTVSKEELAKMIVQAKGISTSTPSGTFTDVPIAGFNAEYIERLLEDGITEGCAVTPNKYCPKEAVTIEVFNNILNKAFQ